MQKKLPVLLLLTSFLIGNLVSCSKGSDTPAPPPTTSTKCDGTPGPLFTAVKTMMAQKCVSCHNNSIANGNMNWTVDCNIITNQARIKIRAVDQGSMPPTGTLPQADKDKITAWITAGGNITN